MDGCFCVYVVNTTDALLLFFKQRNLENIPVSRLLVEDKRPLHRCSGEHSTRVPRGHRKPATGQALRSDKPPRQAGLRLTAAVYRGEKKLGEGTASTVGAARTRRAFSGPSAPIGPLPAPTVSPGARGIQATGPGCHARRADRLRSRPQGDASTAGPSAAGAPPHEATGRD